MKKIIAAILAFMMVFFAGCGGEKDEFKETIKGLEKTYDVKLGELIDAYKNPEENARKTGNLYWAYQNGVLLIFGEGDMKYYKYGATPWENYCEEIKYAIVMEGVTSLGGYAFGWCPALEGVTLPDGLTTITEFAFYGCHALKTVTIPASVQEIQVGTFIGCNSLEKVTIYGEEGKFDTDKLLNEGVEVVYVTE